MKLIFLSLFIVLLTVDCTAQAKREKDFIFSGGLDIAYAVGNFQANHSLGFGISLQSEYIFSDNAAVTVNTGFMSFATKSVIDSSLSELKQPAAAFIPLLIGLKLDNDKGFYIHPQVGVAFRFNEYIKTKKIGASYGLIVGIKKSAHADFSFRYQVVHKTGVVASFFAVRAAYVL
jgi:hypothetical protein